MTKPFYSFDTSAFVDWWVRYYPPAILPSLKKQMEGIVQEGRLKASRSVYDELEVGGDELFNWVKTYRSEIIVEDDADVQKLARPLIAKYSSPSRPRNGLNGADPFVIAQAQRNSPTWIVVSGEKGCTVLQIRGFLWSYADESGAVLRNGLRDLNGLGGSAPFYH